MIRLYLLLFLLSVSIIGGCGFHFPYKKKSISFDIRGEVSSSFAREIKKTTLTNTEPSLILIISNETKSKSSGSYGVDGLESGYNLSYNVDIKALDFNNKVLMENTYSLDSYSSKLESEQADSIQTEEKYSRMIKSIVSRVVRQLIQLHEN